MIDDGMGFKLTKEWRGEGLPEVDSKVMIENSDGHYLSYGQDVIGKKVIVRALFKIEDIDMSVVEHYGVCYCFRASMLRPILTHRERWVDQVRDILRYQTQDKTCIQAIHDALANGTLPTPEKDND